MKKQILTVSLSLLIILSCLFAACTADKLAPTPTPSDDEVPSPTVNYEAQIRELENKISELQQSQSVSDAERQKELAELTERLEALKAEAGKQETTTPEEDESDPSVQGSRFLYTVTDGKATITGYTGSEASVVIPSAIDGYTVYDIADSAFSSSTLKSVTISNGICRIDWFAFRDCPKLEAITVPPSVTSIGYSAFPSNSKILTVYCHSGSFAQAYAKSYGLNYAVI